MDKQSAAQAKLAKLEEMAAAAEAEADLDDVTKDVTEEVACEQPGMQIDDDLKAAQAEGLPDARKLVESILSYDLGIIPEHVIKKLEAALAAAETKEEVAVMIDVITKHKDHAAVVQESV